MISERDFCDMAAAHIAALRAASDGDPVYGHGYTAAVEETFEFIARDFPRMPPGLSAGEVYFDWLLDKWLDKSEVHVKDPSGKSGGFWAHEPEDLYAWFKDGFR